MKNRIFLLLLAFMLIASVDSGAIAQLANDPSTPCFRQIVNDNRFGPLRDSLGMSSRASDITIEMMSNNRRPIEDEKRIISIWAAERDRCLEMGRRWRADNVPPQLKALIDSTHAALKSLIAKLYGGSISYGEFIMARQKNSQEFDTQIAMMYQKNIEQTQNSKARAAESPNNNSRQHQLPNRTLTTNCYRFDESLTHCTTQ